MAAGSSEKKKKILLAVLLVTAVVIAVYNVFLSGPPPRPRLNSQSAASERPEIAAGAPITTARQAESVAGRNASTQADVSDIATLNLALLRTSSGDTAIGNRGNIFAYYVPPPPPPPPPPAPPPILVQFIQPQTGVAGTPKAFTLTVTGKGFPEDARVVLNGTPKPTRRVNQNTLSIEMTPESYASQGTISVEVQSPSDPKLFSNKVPFIAQPAPQPPFKYIGRIGDQGLFEIGATKELMRVGKGGTIQGVWRIDSITDSGAEVTDTRHDITKRLAMEGKDR